MWLRAAEKKNEKRKKASTIKNCYVAIRRYIVLFLKAYGSVYEWI